MLSNVLEFNKFLVEKSQEQLAITQKVVEANQAFLSYFMKINEIMILMGKK